MSIVPDSVLVKSKAARDHQLERISPQRAQQILNNLKVLYFAVWKGEGTTTELLAAFYKVPEVNIRQLLKTHRAEFESDRLQTLRGRQLKQLRNLLSLTSITVNTTTWTPRAAMRLGMLLSNSALAQAFTGAVAFLSVGLSDRQRAKGRRRIKNYNITCLYV